MRMGALLTTVEELSPRLPKRGRLLGLDLGTKTIGVGVSDVERRIATPLRTIRRTRFSADAAELIRASAEFEACAFVLGLPLNMDGREGPRAQSTRAFARNLAPLLLEDHPCLAIVFWDERLSTAAVERSLIANDVSRARRTAIIDQHAAAYILQGALDRLAAIRANS